ncbi:Retrotransposon-derived protein PEG10 [Smittium culicis]|uniref:Retrotransposon-derived protein PEG10 n=1 Tax=Smittium culicis TaxID=133412 RepID=A0A1R1YBV2_9FUNG|nr:Retrotransposon-derived protein PEG10 [Smittium culicis]
MNEEQFNQLTTELQILREENARLQALQGPQVPAIVPTLSPAHAPSIRISLPERYNGDRSQFRGFTNQCCLLFFTYPDHYPSETNNVGLIMSLLTENALRWASPYIEKGGSVLQDYELFLKEFSKVFDGPHRTQTANDAIRALRQGSSTVSMYASEFKRLMMDLDWNESALVSQFAEGLNENILDTLALFQSPLGLEGYINAAITFDSVQRTVSQPERDRRIKLGLCFYCGGSGSKRKIFLNLKKPSTVSTITASMSKTVSNQNIKIIFNHSNRFMIPVTIRTSRNHSFEIMAIIDSDGSPPNEGPITHHTKPLKIQIQEDHWELATFDVMTCHHADMILGLPWLEIHDPDIDWKTRSISFNKDHCIKNCLKNQKNYFKVNNNYTPVPIVDPTPDLKSYQPWTLPIVNNNDETQSQSTRSQSQENQVQDGLETHQEDKYNGLSSAPINDMESHLSTADSSSILRNLEPPIQETAPIPTIIRTRTSSSPNPVVPSKRIPSDIMLNEKYPTKKRRLTVPHMIGLIIPRPMQSFQ